METIAKEVGKTTRNIAIVDGNADILEKVKGVMKVVTGEKLMKSFNRTVNDNVKLDRFLSAEFKLPKAFDPAQLEKTITQLCEPKNHEHHGLINIDKQKAILTLLEQGLIETEIVSKKAWLNTFKLNEEQERKAAEVMTKYERQMRAATTKATKAWRQLYGE